MGDRRSFSPLNKKIKRSNPHSSVTGAVILNPDDPHATHAASLVRVTPEGRESLGNRSKARERVTRACEKRSSIMGGRGSGVRCIDWLGGKTHLVGDPGEQDQRNGVSGTSKTH